MAAMVAMQVMAGDYVTVSGGHFRTPGTQALPYRFIGANCADLSYLFAQGEDEGLRQLQASLDELQRVGTNHVRLSISPAALSDTLFNATDCLLDELERRHMYATFFLDTDACQSAERATTDVGTFIRAIVSRTNGRTGRPYSTSPAIMAWQFPATLDGTDEDAAVGQVARTAAAIKAADPNHLIAVAPADGMAAVPLQRYERLHNIPAIDYCTLRLMPLELHWASPSTLYTALPNVYLKADEFVARYERVARKCNKPLVIDAIAYPRDRSFLSPGAPALGRDAFFNYVFRQLSKSITDNGNIAGVCWGEWRYLPSVTPDAPPAEQDGETRRPGNSGGIYDVCNNDSTTLQVIADASKQVKF